MTFEEARHLLGRTGFGGTFSEIQDLTGFTRREAIERILSRTITSAVTPPPNWVTDSPPLPRERKRRSQEEKLAFRRKLRAEGLELKAWWLQEIHSTPSPFTERMTLFWHNHFTSSLQKVKWPPFLYSQNVLFRRMGCGSFRNLLFTVAKDPAMMMYLDTQSNHKDRPNENFARELFELFTLGEGHYTEQDIKEAARAFTGWKLDRRNGTFRVARRQQDTGTKTVLRKTGDWSGDDILTIALDQPSTAPHIVKKFWCEFVSDSPDSKEVDRLAALFRHGDYQIKPLLTELLASPHFWAPEQRGTLVRSPVELMIGTVRLFDLPLEDSERLPKFCRRLGQDVFNPPNVKGWPGGNGWINTKTLLDRWQWLQRAIRGHETGMPRHGMKRRRMRKEPPLPSWMDKASLDTIKTVLLPIPPVQPIQDGKELWQIVRQLVLDPAYQLK